MPDYKEMYLTLMRAVEGALNLLIDAQRKCEQMYMRTKNLSLTLRLWKNKNSSP